MAIVGMGNILLKDEGIGVHVVGALEAAGIGSDGNIQLLDGGTSLDVLSTLRELDRLIIIDAACGECQPGTIYRFGLDDIDHQTARVDSMHQIGLAEWLHTWRRLGPDPRDVVIFGIQPKEVDWGLELSAEVAESIPNVMNLVLEEARRC